MYGDGWWWHMGWMWIFWVGLVILVVWVVQRASTSSAASAEEILKRRYAQGHIGKEEYGRSLRDLRR